MSSENRPQDEIVPLNADQLDAETLGELNEETLEDVAGGGPGTCGTFTCGTNSAT